LGVVVVPGGIITQIYKANRRFDEKVAASPMGKLCYHCNGPAIQVAEYTDGSVRYFCEQHPPPRRSRATSPGDQGSKGFNPGFALVLVLGFVSVNTARALVQVVRPWKGYVPTLPGAIIGLVTVIGAWIWFFGLTQ
jgi:hypothetical protein